MFARYSNPFLQYLKEHLHFFLCTDKEATVRKSSNNTILRVADIARGDKKIFDTLGYKHQKTEFSLSMFSFTLSHHVPH